MIRTSDLISPFHQTIIDRLFDEFIYESID